MNKKHFLIVLVMVAVASASLFGGFQAYRYNRSLMNKSVFSNNIEAKADNLEEGGGGSGVADWWNRKDWKRNLEDCSFVFSFGIRMTVTINGVPAEVERGAEIDVPHGKRWVCERKEDGKGELAHCIGTFCL